MSMRLKNQDSKSPWYWEDQDSEGGGFVVSKDGKVITKKETINNIFYLSEGLKKGVYKWAIEVENNPENWNNIITGVITKKQKQRFVQFNFAIYENENQKI